MALASLVLTQGCSRPGAEMSRGDAFLRGRGALSGQTGVILIGSREDVGWALALTA